MKFYTRQHQHYCGIDLHARQMYVCILDAAGKVCLSRNLECSPQVLLAAVQPFREDLVVAVECMFAWVTGWPMWRMCTHPGCGPRAICCAVGVIW